MAGALVLAALATAGGLAAAAGPATPTTYSVGNPLPPRLQWDANNGYCGEVAFISAGLSYGQYLSQYDARAIASNNTPQYEKSSQLLLGGNDTYAAAQMRLDSSEWQGSPGTSTAAFLTWVKSQVIQGFPVALGLYTNEYRFYGKTDPTAGDPQYDHIVVVTGVTSHSPLTLPATYHPDDVLTFSDNGLWTGTPDGKPQYVFHAAFGSFAATRPQANAPGAPLYSLPSSVRHFAIALTGVTDPAHETLPVRVSTNVNYETPHIQNGSNVRPASMPLTLTVTVSGLHPGTAYTVYRYDSVAAVPTTAFNSDAAAAAQSWHFTAGAGTYSLSQVVRSDDQVLYRAVPSAGP